MKRPLILVTGATGFVGEAVVFRLLLDKLFTPLAAVRSESRLKGLCDVVHWDINSPSTVFPLADVTAVVHCAARVHVMKENGLDELAEFRRVNVEGTLRLASEAAHRGVPRFIYISSVKVNGESTQSGKPFKPSDISAPLDPYGLSKFEAEEGLKKISQDTGMELVIIRPPLVYGPGVKANFLNMMAWLEKGYPLPFGAISNKRSFVFVGNLVDLIVRCISHPAAAGGVFMVSDGIDLSTTQLLKRMAGALGKGNHLLPVPAQALRLAGKLTGRAGVIQRLCDSLQVDISDTCKILSWVPPVSTEVALLRTARHYQDKKS